MIKVLQSTLLLSFLVLLVPAFAAAQESAASASPPCSTGEYRQFDFWVGDWIVRTPDGAVAGTNLVEKTLNDCVITEHWQGTSDSVGRSLSMFFSRDGGWHQTWVDGSGGRLDLVGGWDGEKMVLSGTMPGADGAPVLHEISWTPRADGTVRQYWRVSKDDGESWGDVFVGIYSRKTGD